MKRFIILFIAVLIGQTAFAQGWEQQVSPTNQNLNSVVFVDTSNGWAVGDSGTIIHTIDGGSNWTLQTSGTVIPLRSVKFPDVNHGWAVGGRYSWEGNLEGCVLHTTDGGEVWTTQVSDTGLCLSGVDFADVNNGWAVGTQYADTVRGFVLHTTDGGVTWTPQDSIARRPLYSVDFVDTNNGWVVGGDAVITPDGGYEYRLILHTTDGGGTWARMDRDAMPLVCVTFVDTNHGWAAGIVCARWGCRSIIVFTTDGDNTWVDELDSDSSGCLFTGLNFVDASNGWAVCGRAYIGRSFGIHRTRDGGVTWTVEDGTASLQSVHAVDRYHAWAVGASGGIFSRPLLPLIEVSPTELNFGRVHIGNDSVAFLTIQNSGEVALTVAAMTVPDGYEVLFSLPLTIDAGDSVIDTVRFHPTQTGWHIGNLVITSNAPNAVPAVSLIGQGLPPLSANASASDMPRTFLLRENYPNPFNPSTTIAYDLPKAGHISLRVFDLLGREVAVLKDGFVEAGSHRVRFDGINLALGIYFARLDAGTFSQTKKLMLLK
jgi:photosystem II stability/assembly factor-like uncharacterized protein